MISLYTMVYNSLLQFTCLFLFGYFVLNKKPVKRWIWVSAGVFTGLTILAFIGNTELFWTFYWVLVVLLFWLLKRIFKDMRMSTVLYIYVVLWLVNLLLSAFGALIVPCSYSLIDCIVNTAITVMFAVVCVTPLRNKVQQIIELTPKYVFLISATMLLFAAATSGLITSFVGTDFPEAWTRFIQIAISALLLIICTVIPVIFMISISNSRLKAQTEEYENQIQIQADYYKELAKANYETRRFRHDFKNMHIAIQQLLLEGKSEEALEQLRLQDQIIQRNVPRFDTGNSFADALLSHKQTKAEQTGTQICFKGALSADTPEPTDLCVILGNTLDNAIEACEKLPGEKEITVNAVCNSGFLFLTVCNPAPGPVAVRGGTVATTKDNKTLHGFGLYSLNAVVRKYDGTVKLISEKDSFTAEIELCLMKPSKKK